MRFITKLSALNFLTFYSLNFLKISLSSIAFLTDHIKNTQIDATDQFLLVCLKERRAARRAARLKRAAGSGSDTETPGSSDDWTSESETEKESEGEGKICTMMTDCSVRN